MTNKINGIDVSGAELYEKIVQLQKEIEAYKQSENEAKEIIAELEHKNNCLQKKNDKLKKKKDEYFVMNLNYEIKISYLIQALEEIRDITERLITELPEYNSCYYKDECGDNCTPKKRSKVEYCCYENVDKILTMINEVLNDRD